MTLKRPPQLFVERAAAGEAQPDLDLSPAERAALEERASALRTDDDRWRVEHASLPDPIERAIGAPTRPPRRAYLAAATALFALGGAAALAVTARAPRDSLEPATAPHNLSVRAKGAPDAQLLAWRRRAGVTHPIADGDPVRAGDTLQLAYRAPAPGFGAIASVDGAGQVTLHFPSAPGPAGALEPGKPVRLERAFRLDDAPGFEHVVLVTSLAPFQTDTLLDALRANPGAAPALGPSFSYSTALFPKSPTP